MSWIAALAPGHAHSGPLAGEPAAATDDWRLSDGEVHYLWWFIQGSIMVPDVRWRLRRAWGLCGRHAWGTLVGDASYRDGYLHGQTLLYEDLMERALDAFHVSGPSKARRIGRRLRETGPCLMCEMDLRARDGGAARQEILDQGRNPRALQRFAAETRRYWRPTVCGRCEDTGVAVRCRVHLRDDVGHGQGDDPESHRALVEHVLAHLRLYSRSFVFDHHGTETDEDRAALISAVGWCSGWRGLLTVVQSGRP